MTSGFAERCEQIGWFGFVHLAAVDIGGCVRLAVRAPGVQVVRVVVRLLTTALDRIGNANCEVAVRRTGETVRSRIGAEVVIEGTVLLHDHDDVLDLVDTSRRSGRLALRSGVGRAGREGEDDSDGQGRQADG
jgi:hypothetical protein